jgi:hypothetical protein
VESRGAKEVGEEFGGVDELVGEFSPEIFGMEDTKKTILVQ